MPSNTLPFNTLPPKLCTQHVCASYISFRALRTRVGSREVKLMAITMSRKTKKKNDMTARIPNTV